METQAQTKKDMFKILNRFNLNAVYHHSNDSFNRNITFTSFEKEYKIEWWINMSILRIGDVAIKFDHLKVSGCYPNNFELSIIFELNGQIVCILPIK